MKATTGQQELPVILAKTARNVDDFFRYIVDLIATEDITLQKLNNRSVIFAREQMRVSYLIVHERHAETAQIVEYRMDSEGHRMDDVGRQEGYLVTFGFALDCDYFSTAFQPESKFRFLGQQKIATHEAYVVAFAQQPQQASLLVTLTGSSGIRLPMLMQGVLWVDKNNFQILRTRTDLLAPHPEAGLDRQTTAVTFDGVQLPGIAAPLWLPQEVKVTLRINGRSYHNEHRYSDYRRYRVSVKMAIPR